MVAFPAPRAHAASFTVDSTLDTSDDTPGDGVCDDGSGNCTLRAAIEEANALAGTDTINFNISGSGVKTITLGSVIPDITEAVTINGTTQSGSSCGDLWGGVAPVWNIVVDVDAVANYALRVTADNTTIKGLEIINAANASVQFAGGGHTFQCNYLHDNNAGVFFIGGSDSLVGGPSAGMGNVIAGVAVDGVTVDGATDTVIQGNFLGTTVAGTATDSTEDSIYLTGAVDTIIGGITAGTGNLIGGSNHRGIDIDGESTGTVIQGNYIGTNRAGTAAVPNILTGVLVTGDSSDVTIGGTSVGSRNVISGNTSAGIRIDSGSSDVTIQGNYIGPNAAGTAGIGNQEKGIDDGGMGTIIGGATSAARNIIAGNFLVGGLNPLGPGIQLTGSGAIIQGNYIGSGPTGISSTASLGNLVGIVVQSTSTNNTIGGTTAGAGNVIVNSISDGAGLPLGAGIFLIGGNNTIQGNSIGVGADGTTSLPNEYGVFSFGSTVLNNTIGGTSAGAGNTIANNSLGGVNLAGDPGFGIGAAGAGNAILRNSIYANAGAGIDLSGNPTAFTDGITPNDTTDPDTGPNNLQNFPVLSSATTDDSTTTVAGSLNSLASTTYRLEFFANASADASGYGEGETYLGSTTVTTDGSGDASFSASSLTATTVGYSISATASQDLGGGNFSTSEFSADVTATAPPSPPAPAPSAGSGGVSAPGWSILIGPPPTTTPPIAPSPTPTPGSSTPVIPPEGFTRNLAAERLAIATFVRLFPRLPASPSDWLAVNHLAYGNRIWRNLDAERRGLTAFTKRFLRLPSADSDWRIVHVLGYLNGSSPLAAVR